MRRLGCGIRRLALLLLVLLGCVGCGLPVKPSKPVEPFSAGARPASTEASSTMEVKGVELRLYDTRPSGGEERKPTFWIHADVCSLLEENIWSFEKAHAIIYGRDQAEEPIRLEAGRGRFQESKMAYLKDGVDAFIGAMHIRLQDIEWINDENVARSDSPLSIMTPRSYLEAASLRLYPEKRQLVLTHVSGLIQVEQGEEL